MKELNKVRKNKCFFYTNFCVYLNTYRIYRNYCENRRATDYSEQLAMFSNIGNGIYSTQSEIYYTKATTIGCVIQLFIGKIQVEMQLLIAFQLHVPVRVTRTFPI